MISKTFKFRICTLKGKSRSANCKYRIWVPQINEHGYLIEGDEAPLLFKQRSRLGNRVRFCYAY